MIECWVASAHTGVRLQLQREFCVQLQWGCGMELCASDRRRFSFHRRTYRRCRLDGEPAGKSFGVLSITA